MKQWLIPNIKKLVISETEELYIPTDAWCYINVKNENQRGPNPQGKCNHSNASNNILSGNLCRYIHTHSQSVGVDAICRLWDNCSN